MLFEIQRGGDFAQSNHRAELNYPLEPLFCFIRFESYG